MFKKLQDWLFKEDVEELDLEGEDFSYLEEEDEPVVERVKPTPKEVVEKVEVEEVKPVVKPKTIVDIKADGPEVEKQVEKTKRETRRAPLTRKDEFEMPQVISPFFGVSGEDNTTSTTTNRVEVKPTTPKKDSFNSVISPYYGQKENKGEIYRTKHNSSSSDNVAFINADDVLASDTFDEDNISLDEIVSSTTQSEDDLVQFSLFGEDKKLQNDTFENEEVEIEKHVIDDSDELPF